MNKMVFVGMKRSWQVQNEYKMVIEMNLSFFLPRTNAVKTSSFDPHSVENYFVQQKTVAHCYIIVYAYVQWHALVYDDFVYQYVFVHILCIWVFCYYQLGSS